MKNEFTAVIEPAEEGGHFAYCPEVPEANGQGETREEALDSLSQAIELVLEAGATMDCWKQPDEQG